jgi:FdhD/NarQ family
MMPGPTSRRARHQAVRASLVRARAEGCHDRRAGARGRVRAPPLAASLAEETGLTLVGFLRGTTMNVYAGAERVTSGASAPAASPG